MPRDANTQKVQETADFDWNHGDNQLIHDPSTQKVQENAGF